MKFLASIVKLSLAAVVAGAVLTGCGNTSSSENLQSASEVASGSVAAVAVATENNGSYGHGLFSVGNSFYAAPGGGNISSSDSVACRELKAAADCGVNNGTIQLALDNCTRGRDQWKGIEQLAFSAQAVCEARLHSRGVPVSGSLVRTFIGVIGDPANPATYRIDGDRKWTYDTTTAYGYSEAVSGGTQVEFSLDSTGLLPMRTVTVKGVRVVAEGAIPHGEKACPHGVGEGKKRGEGVRPPPPPRDAADASASTSGSSSSTSATATSEVKWDNSISNDVAHPVKIVGTGKDKKILAGGITKVQHNLNQFTSITVIDEDLAFAAECCHPISGKVNTTFTVDKDGVRRAPETLKFTSQCGVAELTASDGSTSSIQLKGCF